MHQAVDPSTRGLQQPHESKSPLLLDPPTHELQRLHASGGRPLDPWAATAVQIKEPPSAGPPTHELQQLHASEGRPFDAF